MKLSKKQDCSKKTCKDPARLSTEYARAESLELGDLGLQKPKCALMVTRRSADHVYWCAPSCFTCRPSCVLVFATSDHVDQGTVAR